MEQITLNKEQRLYLHFILEQFRTTNRWPTFRQLDRFFVQMDPDLDIETIWKSLPAGLTSYLDLRNFEANASLTVPGIYALEPDALELKIFLETVRLCVDTFMRLDRYQIGSASILRELQWFEPSVRQVGYLLFGEPNIWKSFDGPGPDGEWSCTFTREIRRFRTLTTIEDYLEKQNPPLPQPPPLAVPPPSDADISSDMSVQPYPAVLHPDIRMLCWDQYVQGNYDTAVLNATKALEVAVRKKAQLADAIVGVDIMTQAFNVKKPLLEYSLIPAEQEGMMALLRGIIQVYKNPQSHRFVGMQDASECLGILLMCSSLLALIDRLQRVETLNPSSGPLVP